MVFRGCFCAKGGIIMWPLAQNCPCKADSAPALKQDSLQRLTAVPSHLSCLPHLITSSFLLPPSSFLSSLLPSFPVSSPSPLLSIVRHPFSPSCRTTIPYLPLSLMRQRSGTEGIVNSGAVAYLYENFITRLYENRTEGWRHQGRGDHPIGNVGRRPEAGCRQGDGRFIDAPAGIHLRGFLPGEEDGGDPR